MEKWHNLPQKCIQVETRLTKRRMQNSFFFPLISHTYYLFIYSSVYLFITGFQFIVLSRKFSIVSLQKQTSCLQISVNYLLIRHSASILIEIFVLSCVFAHTTKHRRSYKIRAINKTLSSAWNIRKRKKKKITKKGRSRSSVISWQLRDSASLLKGC